MTRRLHLFLFALTALVFIAGAAPGPAGAQSAVELENVGASYRFGEQITFHAMLRSPVPLKDVLIVISYLPQGHIHVEPLQIQPDGSTVFRFDILQKGLRPFTDVHWSYRFIFPDGSTTQSETFSIRYTDDRFAWHELEEGPVRVHWYQGDAAFGQLALEAALAGIESIRRYLVPDLTQPVDIFIYAHIDDLRSTLFSGRESWVMGYAEPPAGTALVVIEPGTAQTLSMQQRLPHELMHIMLYRRTDTGYYNLPLWLREGLAGLAETGPAAEQAQTLREAARDGGLLPLKDLCTAFPADTRRALLAYAQSRSFASYLHDNYGAGSLEQLAAAYARGQGCAHGPEEVFATSLSTLELRWQESLTGRNGFLRAFESMAVYMVLLGLVLAIPLIGIAATMLRRGNAVGS